MLRGVYTGVCGMLTQQSRLDAVATNAANLNTPGYLRKRSVVVGEFAEILFRVGGKAAEAVGTAQLANAAADAPCDSSPGGLRETGRPLDVAAGGELFFSVLTPQGTLYTRDGRFAIDGEGYLVNKDGYRALGEDGNPLRPGTEDVRFLPDGTLLAQGRNAGRLALFDLGNPVSAGNNLYAGNAVQVQGEVKQGYLTNSNADMVKEVTEAMGALRIYEASQRAVVTGDQTLGTLIASLR